MAKTLSKKKNILTIFGWFGFAVALAYFVYSTQQGIHADVSYPRNTRDIVLISIALLIGGYLLDKSKTKLGIGQGRCRTCGKIIPKSEVFCFDHGLKQIWDAQDSTRDKFNRR